MSLDFMLNEVQPTTVFSANITHNLNTMADAAGLYQVLWRPEELGFVTARDCLSTLREGFVRLLESPDHFKQFDAKNGWGTYDDLVSFVRKVIAACEQHPDATVSLSR